VNSGTIHSISPSPRYSEEKGLGDEERSIGQTVTTTHRLPSPKINALASASKCKSNVRFVSINSNARSYAFCLSQANQRGHCTLTSRRTEKEKGSGLLNAINMNLQQCCCVQEACLREEYLNLKAGEHTVSYKTQSLFAGKAKRGRRKQLDSRRLSVQWLAIALNRWQHERYLRIDNNGRRRVSATMIEVARFKTRSWPLAC
jgi:hypothetical protein